MSRLSLVCLLPLLLGCAAKPIVVRSAPSPSPAALQAARDAQSRRIPIPTASVFPKVLDLLLDRGFQIVAADRDLGFVALRGTWQDQGQGVGLTVEGSLLVRPEGDGTRLRLLLHGRWEYVDAVKGGRATVSAISEVDPGEYRRLLDDLEAGLKEGGA